MAVQQRLSGHRPKSQFQPPGLRLARQEFLEQKSIGGKALRRVARNDRGDFIAEAKDAARLQSNHRNAAREIRIECGQHAFGFLARLVDQPNRKKCAAAAERARFLIDRCRNMHAITGGLQHRQGGVEILTLEIAVEGIGEENDLARCSGRLAVFRVAQRYCAAISEVCAAR